MTALRTIADLKPGDHLCWAYDSEEEHRSLLMAFLRQGLERGEKVIYIVDAHRAGVILGYLQEDGIEGDPYLASGQLSILQAGDLYLRDQTFDPARMLTCMREEIECARAEGYPALRLTGEASWALRGTDGAALVEYESAVNGVIVAGGCVALCQYQRWLFDPDLLARVLSVHPTIIVGGTLYDSPNGRELGLVGRGDGAWPAPHAGYGIATLRESVESASVRAISEQRIALSGVRELCLWLDAEGRVVDCKVAQGEALYLQPSTLLGRRVADVLPPEIGLEAQRAVDGLPGRDALIAVECAFAGAEGERAFEVRALPLPERRAVLLLRDVTEPRRAEKARQFLTEVSRALATSLGYEMTLQRVARLAVPVLADGCLLSVTQDPARPQIAVAHVDPAHEELLVEVQRPYLVQGRTAPLVREIVETGQPRVFPEVSDSLLAAATCDAAHLEVIRQLGVDSAMAVPLAARGQVLGTIWFLSTASGRRYGPADLALAVEMAGRAAVAIDNAWLYRSVQRARAEARAAERRMAFLAEASKALAASLDYETTLQSTARLAVPVLADWCVVETIEGDGASRQAAVAHVDPAKDGLLRELGRQHAPRPDGPRPSDAVIRTGQPLLLQEIPESGWVTGDAGHAAALQELGIGSAMVVPLVARGRTLGAISLASGEAGRYDAADLALAEGLARRCALAIDNALLYRQAREAVRVREEFLSAAAHELKTPLTSLRGFAQLTLRRLDSEREIDQAQLKRALEVIDRQSDRLSRLVSQLLDVSRLEDGQLRLDRQAIDLARLIADAVSMVQACTVRHSFAVRVPSSLPALVDPLRLEQVLISLLDSAVRASQEGGEIEVEGSTPDPATVRLSVRGYGASIPRKRRGSVVDARGEQADNHFEDLGLSLSISRRIVEQHGGRIELELPADGGILFVVSLPRGLDGADDRAGDES